MSNLDRAGADVARELDAALRERSLSDSGNAQFQDMQRQLNQILGANLEVDGYATLRANRGQDPSNIERLSNTQQAIAEFINDYAPELAGRNDLTVDNLLGAIEEAAELQRQGLLQRAEDRAAYEAAAAPAVVVAAEPVVQVAAAPAPVDTAEIITPAAADLGEPEVRIPAVAELMSPPSAGDLEAVEAALIPAAPVEPHQSFGVRLDPTVLETTGEELTGIEAYLNADVTDLITQATVYGSIDAASAFDDLSLVSYLLEKDDRTSEDVNIAVQTAYTALDNIRAQLMSLPEESIGSEDREYLLTSIGSSQERLAGHLEAEGVPLLTASNRIVTDLTIALASPELAGMEVDPAGIAMDLTLMDRRGETDAFMHESYTHTTAAIDFLQGDNNADSWIMDQLQELRGMILMHANAAGIDPTTPVAAGADIDLISSNQTNIGIEASGAFDVAVMSPAEVEAVTLEADSLPQLTFGGTRVA